MRVIVFHKLWTVFTVCLVHVLRHTFYWSHCGLNRTGVSFYYLGHLSSIANRKAVCRQARNILADLKSLKASVRLKGFVVASLVFNFAYPTVNIGFLKSRCVSN